MAAANLEQRLLVLLYMGSVLSMTEYVLAILTLSSTQTERLKRIKNEAMRAILECTRNTSLSFSRHEQQNKISQAIILPQDKRQQDAPTPQ